MAAAPPVEGASRRAAVSFTGGKDSMTVLHLMRAPEVALQAVASNDAWRDDVRARLAQVAGCEVSLLVTFVPAGGKQSFKAHPLEVVQLQARALGLPHIVMEVAAAPSFLDSYSANIRALRERHGITALATGDILDVCSSFMPRAAAGTGVELLAPLWGIERRLLLELVWAYDMSPLITCVNMTKFAAAGGAGAAGREAAERAGAAGGREGSSAASSGSDGGVAAENLEAAATEAARVESCPRGDAVGAGAGAGAAGTQLVECGGGGAGHGVMGEAGVATGRLLGHRLERRLYDEVLLPAKQLYGVDEGGEWGEYHTMVTASRLFSAPLQLSYEPRQEGDFAFLGISEAELRA